MAYIHKDDEGTQLRVQITESDVAVDVSSAQSITFIIQKPDGTVITKAGSNVTDGTDGWVRYVTVDGDINQQGWYELEVHVQFLSTEYYTDIERIRVGRIIAEV